jgi:hypothetical protein
MNSHNTNIFPPLSIKGISTGTTAVVLVCQVPIHPGVDDGGKRRGVTLVGLRGSQRQAGKGGGGGAAL